MSTSGSPSCSVGCSFVLSAGDGTKDEIRRAFQILPDDGLVAGFLIDMQAGIESSPKLSDLDGDGKMEFIVVDAAGIVHVLDEHGAEKTGWPQKLNKLVIVDETMASNHLLSNVVTSGALDEDTRSSVIATVAIGDLDGSGGTARDVVAASLDGYVFAWSSSGTLLAGFPVQVSPTAGLVGTRDKNFVDVGIFAAPVLADRDANGDLEIVVGCARASMNGAAALVGVDERREFSGAARAAGFVVVVIDDGVDGVDVVNCVTFGSRQGRAGSLAQRLQQGLVLVVAGSSECAIQGAADAFDDAKANRLELRHGRRRCSWSLRRAQPRARSRHCHASAHGVASLN